MHRNKLKIFQALSLLTRGNNISRMRGESLVQGYTSGSAEFLNGIKSKTSGHALKPYGLDERVDWKC